VDDQRLAEMLLASLPTAVVLVGEPVFRLSDVLGQLTAAPDYSGVAPSILQSEQLTQQAIGFCQSSSAQSTHAVMCLHMSAETAAPEKLLGLACRAAPQQLMVEHTTSLAGGKLLADEQFFAFGFRRLEKNTETEQQKALYSYRLSDYKQAPDWLNARFWANPERFDLTE